MFGASWCPHCAAQKLLFGRSVESLPYFECALNGTQEQVKECNDRGIVSYPTWQFSEPILASLPKTAMTNLLNTEIDKVRSATKSYRDAFKDKPDVLKTIDAFEKKSEAMINSDMADFDKLKNLTTLSETPTGVEELHVYVDGRIAGERTLSDLALYTGCSTAYQSDISAVKK